MRAFGSSLLVLALLIPIAACGGGGKSTKKDPTPVNTGGGGGGGSASTDDPSTMFMNAVAKGDYQSIFDQCQAWSNGSPTAQQLLACASFMPPALVLTGRQDLGFQLIGKACESIDDKMSLVTIASVALLLPINQPGADADKVKAQFQVGVVGFSNACGLDPSAVVDAIQKQMEK
jgi:hypothetical protein